MKKRSRNAGSPSLADVLILDMETKRSRDVTTTLDAESSLSMSGTSCNGFGIVKFLNECGWCRKWISDTTDVFMYAGCAYCTEKCREWQYEKDAKAGRISPVRIADQMLKKKRSLVKITTIPLK